jgi:4-hydroxybenzoate polyprenyltransferase
MMSSRALTEYFRLIRLPNIFTALTNVLVGYFAVTSTSNVTWQLGLLMGSSSLLYASGVVFNDLADIKIDSTERPSRPLPSGRVSVKNATKLAIAAIVFANVLAAIVGLLSLAVSLALSAAIILYDYRTKSGRLGPLTMATTRLLNIFLGASVGFTFGHSIWSASIAASLLFGYVYAISIASRAETLESRSVGLAALKKTFAIICAIIVALVVFAVAEKHYLALVNVGIFSGIMIAIFTRAKRSSSSPATGIQSVVKNLVISIIILDSVFITAFAGFLYGIVSLAMVVPPILLSKKLYVT